MNAAEAVRLVELSSPLTVARKRQEAIEAIHQETNAQRFRDRLAYIHSHIREKANVSERSVSVDLEHGEDSESVLDDLIRENHFRAKVGIRRWEEEEVHDGHLTGELCSHHATCFDISW